MNCPWRVEAYTGMESWNKRDWVTCCEENCPFWRFVKIEVPNEVTGNVDMKWTKTCVRTRK